MKSYTQKIGQCLILMILFWAIGLASLSNMGHVFNNLPARADSLEELSKPEPLSSKGSSYGPENTDLGKANHLWLAKLPDAPQIKIQTPQGTPAAQTPESLQKPETPQVEPTKSREGPTKVLGLVDVRNYGFTEEAIKKAIDATTQRKGTLYFPSGTWRITGNLTIPAHLAVKIDNGALLSLAPGATLIIEGSLVDCLWQIFDDDNTDLSKGVKLSRHAATYVRPEWWGLMSNGDSATNWKALTKALNCSTIGKAEITVMISPGNFSFADTIQLTPYCHLKGQNYFSASGMGHEGTVLSLASKDHKCLFEGKNIDGPVLENLYIIFGNDADCIFIHGGHYGEIKNCYFETSNLPTGRYAIKMDPQNQMVVENCRMNATNGIYAGNMDGWIRGCEIRGGRYDSDSVAIKAVEAPLVHDCIIYGFARGIDTYGQTLIYGNRIDQCTICINGEKDNILIMAHAVPASPPYEVTVSHQDPAFKDYGVMWQKEYFTDDRIHLTRVPSNPGPGQYTVREGPNGGTYSFNQAEAGKQLWFNYSQIIKNGGLGCNCSIVSNRLTASVVGINVIHGSPIITNNIFKQFRCGGNACAVNFRGAGGLLVFNKFEDNDRNIYCDATKAPLECHDNLGLDRATDSGLLPNSISGDLPEVYAGDLWETKNSSATSITAIKAAAEGHRIALTVDPSTTLQKYWAPSDLYLTSDHNATFRVTAGSNPNFSGQTDFPYFQSPRDGEIIYFGDDTRFNSLLFNIKDNVAAKTVTFNWEYATEWGWIPTLDQVKTWTPDTFYPAGSVIKPEADDTLVVYISQNAGKSGRTEPKWQKLFHGEYHPWAYMHDDTVVWRPFYPLKVTNPEALRNGGTGKVEILFTPPPSTCWVPVNPKNIVGDNFPGGPKFWLRCRLSGVTGGSNGGSNNAEAVKKCNIRLTTDTFNPPAKGILNLLYHNHSWLEIGRGLL